MLVTSTGARPYHHGDLRRAVLRAAADAIAADGPSALSLRDLARRAGVSHAAPAYHFGDKAGLLTAVAAEGFELLADTLEQTRDRTGSFREMGVAYVRFALGYRAHFHVMFRRDLYHADDPALVAARHRSTEALRSGLATVSQANAASDPDTLALAAWSLVHGFATLVLDGGLPPERVDDPEATARSIASVLFAAEPG